MKNYLNSQEKDDMVMLDLLAGYMNERFLIDWKAHSNLTKDEHKSLKTAFTYTNKAFNLILSRLDPRAKLMLERDAECSQIFCLPKTQAKQKLNAFEKLDKDEYVYVKKSVSMDMAEFALEICSKQCDKKTAEEAKVCPIGCACIALDIEPLDATNAICPYYRGGDK